MRAITQTMESSGIPPSQEQIEERDHVRAAFDAAGLADEGVKIGFDEAHIPIALARRLIELYLAAKTALKR